MSTPSNSNRLKGDRFRELVALLLRSDGLPVAKKSAQKLSVAILDDEAGDVQGLHAVEYHDGYGFAHGLAPWG